MWNPSYPDVKLAGTSVYQARNEKKRTRKTFFKYKQVYIEKKDIPMSFFTNLSEDKSIPMTALWCPAFSNYG